MFRQDFVDFYNDAMRRGEEGVVVKVFVKYFYSVIFYLV